MPLVGEYRHADTAGVARRTDEQAPALEDAGTGGRIQEGHVMATNVVTATRSDSEQAQAPGALAVLQSCPAVERRLLRSMAVHVHVDRGEVVCRPGEFGDELFVILDGAVVVQTTDEALSYLGAGDGFGEMAPLARTPRRSTVIALAPTALLVFRRRELAKLLDRAPLVGRALLRAASTRLRACPDRAVEVDA